jgi:hypothetical protein
MFAVKPVGIVPEKVTPLATANLLKSETGILALPDVMALVAL